MKDMSLIAVVGRIKNDFDWAKEVGDRVTFDDEDIRALIEAANLLVDIHEEIDDPPRAVNIEVAWVGEDFMVRLDRVVLGEVPGG